jgi:hypothetical protein
MTRPAIVVKDIHKEFVLPQTKNSSIKHAFVNIIKRNKKTVQKVLDGVSFTINQGDFFGVVGRNGSGKSTMLKILAGVYQPTSGDIQLNGKLTPFIELGVGFNPELSGRDNVFLNGALLGFTRKEMETMYDEIVAFAELEPFMDQKLKNYSSGMQVRLAFSVAIKARNDIMIFDEVLAVGDEAFQHKCIDIFEQYKASGQTVVLVTHDMETVKKFCNRAVLIQDGKIIKEGNPVQVANEYSRLNQAVIDASIDRNRQYTGENVDITIRGAAGKKQRSFKVGETISFDITWRHDKTRAIMVDLYRKDSDLVSNFITNREGFVKLPKDKRLTLDIEANLGPGSYYVDVNLLNHDGSVKYDVAYRAEEFTITKDFSAVGQSFGGLTLIPRQWYHDHK